MKNCTKTEFDPYKDRIWQDSTLKAIVAAGDWKAAIDYCCQMGTNFYDYGRAWSLAMTAHFGPCGLHESRKTLGRPDPVKCIDVPAVLEQMNEAAEALRKTMGVAL